jgi:hypothetical protein
MKNLAFFILIISVSPLFAQRASFTIGVSPLLTTINGDISEAGVLLFRPIIGSGFGSHIGIRLDGKRYKTQGLFTLNSNSYKKRVSDLKFPSDFPGSGHSSITDSYIIQSVGLLMEIDRPFRAPLKGFYIGLGLSPSIIIRAVENRCVNYSSVPSDVSRKKLLIDNRFLMKYQFQLGYEHAIGRNIMFSLDIPFEVSYLPDKLAITDESAWVFSFPLRVSLSKSFNHD